MESIEREETEAESTPVAPEIDALAERIGDFIQYWGFKRVHGRLWTHLLLSEVPLDAGELIRRLRISKALVSMSLSELLQYDVVAEAGKSPRGTQLYQANIDVMDVILGVLRKRERKMLEEIAETFRAVKNLSPQKLKAHRIDKERLLFLGRLVDSAGKALENFLSGFRFDLSALQSLRSLRRKIKS